MNADPGDRLESWKEIASYLKRSVRTVRRWEAEEGLPVHRQMHRALGSVFAYKHEIDAWRQAAEVRRARDTARPAPAGAGPLSIVVLPFTNLSPDPDTEYFADGLTGEVIADLSKVRALRVISRTSAMVLKGTGKDVRAIGRELGVSRVVEGTVRRDGARLRVTATLIDAGNDEHLWAGKFDGTLEDVFAIQEQLARMIVDALKLLALNGRVETVHEVAGSFPASLQHTAAARVTLFLARALAGDRHAALAALTPEIESARYATDVFPRFLAQGYALSGMPDRAIDWLERAVERGFINYPFLARHDPFLRSLEGHPRFGELLTVVRARWETFEA